MPIELFGRTKFPAITEAPYFLTLGPHNFYWFSLETPRVKAVGPHGGVPASVPSLAVADNWTEVLDGQARTQFEVVLPDYLRGQVWFSRVDGIKYVTVKGTMALPTADERPTVLALGSGGPGQRESRAVRGAADNGGGENPSFPPEQGIARISGQDGISLGHLKDAVSESTFAKTLLGLMAGNDPLGDGLDQLAPAIPGEFLRDILEAGPLPSPTLRQAPEGYTTGLFTGRLAMKFYRRLDEGISPDLEVGRYLTGRNFPNCSAVLGALELRRAGSQP